jgi:hypothetical protein
MTLGSIICIIEAIIFGSVMAFIHGSITLGSIMPIIEFIICGLVMAVIQSPMPLLQPSMAGICGAVCAMPATGICNITARAAAIRDLRNCIVASKLSNQSGKLNTTRWRQKVGARDTALAIPPRYSCHALLGQRG